MKQKFFEESGAIQLLSITPVQIANLIVDSFKKEFADKFQPKEPEEWMTRKEVADMFKVDLSTIHRWTKKGVLQKYGIGTKVRFKRSEVLLAVQPVNS